MKADLGDLNAFVAVARAKAFAMAPTAAPSGSYNLCTAASES